MFESYRRRLRLARGRSCTDRPLATGRNDMEARRSAPYGRRRERRLADVARGRRRAAVRSSVRDAPAAVLNEEPEGLDRGEAANLPRLARATRRARLDRRARRTSR